MTPFARIASVVAALALVSVPSAVAIDVSDPSPAIGQYVVVHAMVSTKSGSEIFNPAVYVDWAGGACPATAPAARSAAKGHFLRGMGPAGTSDGFYTDFVPVSARVLVETARQSVCFYDDGGLLAEQTVVKGTPSFPPQTEGGPAKRWGLAFNAYSRTEAVSALSLQMNGLRLAHAGLLGGIYQCEGKRFFLNPAKLHLDRAGHFSYKAAVAPDNSNNYDAPIPAKFHGRALLKLTGTIGIGQQQLKAPVADPTGGDAPSLHKGRWAHPVLNVRGSFSAPGYRPGASAPLCSHAIRYRMDVTVDDPQDAEAMVGQGSARMATDPTVPNQAPGDDAGVGTPVPPDNSGY